MVRRDGSHAFVDFSARKLFSGKSITGYQVSVRDMTEQKDFTKHFPEELTRLEKLRAEWNAGLIPPAFKGLQQAGGEK